MRGSGGRSKPKTSQKADNNTFHDLNMNYMTEIFNEDDRVDSNDGFESGGFGNQGRADQHDHEIMVNQRDSDIASSEEASSDSDDNLGTQSLVFRQFIENLKRIGFFKNMTEGTAEYEKRYMTAKRQFQQQYQSAISPDKPQAVNAPMSPTDGSFPAGPGGFNSGGFNSGSGVSFDSGGGSEFPEFGDPYKPTKTEV